MWQTLTTDYRRAGRTIATAVFGGTLALSAAVTAFAQDGAFEGGGQVSGDAYQYAAAPYALPYQDSLYEYATGKDGKGYYTVYDGQAYSAWAGWEDQPADYQYEPTAVDAGGTQYVFYNGTDGGIYYDTYDGQSWSGWENIAGEYEFAYAPYANTYGDAVYVYGQDAEGALYSKYWVDGAWTEWAAISDDYAAGEYQPYGVEWGGYNNVFWTGKDGKVYWNRYDGTAWTGAKALAGEGDYGSAPYAIGYSPEKKLYAYANAKDGAPYWNSFADGEGWSGWQAYEAELPAKATYQPHAYEYNGVQHVVYTGDDGHAYYTEYAADGGYEEWVDLGANYDYDAQTYEYDGGYYLTYTGTDGYVYVKPYVAAAGGDTRGTEDGYAEPFPTPDY